MHLAQPTFPPLPLLQTARNKRRKSPLLTLFLFQPTGTNTTAPTTVPCLPQTLDNLERMDRNPLAPMRVPIVDKWKDMGTIVMGKIESGFIRVGDVFQVMPNRCV